MLGEEMKILIENQDEGRFNSLTVRIQSLLASASDYLPGPVHPATKFYRLRKQKQIFKQSQTSFAQSSNPMRKSKRDTNRRKDKYNHDKMQHLFYYHRKKCVQQIMTSGRPETCSISLEKIASSFQNRWEVENDSRLPKYAYTNVEVQKEIDESFESSVTKNEIEEVTRGINKDTAAGPDNILIGVLKKVDCSNLLALMATNILRNGFVPESLKLARTVLIYKKGDKNECSNWRPISVCSIIRR